MRAFVALEIPEEFEADLVALARQLGASVQGRFMARDTYHLTLAFLGEIDGQGDVAAASKAIERACKPFAPISLHADGLGKFGKPDDATLWLGISPTPALMELANSVRAELTTAGLTYDSKAFKPHITLARRAKLSKGELPALAFPRSAHAVRVTLFKSELAPEGATYKALKTIKL